MYIGDALFSDDHLSGYLQPGRQSIQADVQRLNLTPGDDRRDEAVVEQLARNAHVESLEIDFDSVEKDVQEARVRVNDFGRDIEVAGVSATRSFPFSGDANLFRLRPNQYTSMLPRGVVQPGLVVIGLTAQNDADLLKRELDRLQELLRD